MSYIVHNPALVHGSHVFNGEYPNMKCACGNRIWRQEYGADKCVVYMDVPLSVECPAARGGAWEMEVEHIIGMSNAEFLDEYVSAIQIACSDMHDNEMARFVCEKIFPEMKRRLGITGADVDANLDKSLLTHEESDIERVVRVGDEGSLYAPNSSVRLLLRALIAARAEIQQLKDRLEFEQRREDNTP